MNFKPPQHQKIRQPDIAVVALSGIFPGAATADRFITNVLDNKEAVIRVPDQRWAAPINAMTDVFSAPPPA